MSTPPSPRFTREQIADAILVRLDDAQIAHAHRQFELSQTTQYFVVDELLPVEMAQAIRESFPDPATMRERRTLREHKYVAVQMNRYDPQGEEALFAFHDPRIIEAVARITGMSHLEADPNLYAGGLSLMARGNFLNPHLDNSHDNARRVYRVLNLLYYVSPGWEAASGGHLELWPNGVKADPITLHSFFNRLVVMTTGPESWHSVSEVRDERSRCCVSNYYFSPRPVGGKDYFRVTTFRGRPEQPLRDLLLRIDASLRQGVRRLFPHGAVRTTHVYDRSEKTRR